MGRGGTIAWPSQAECWPRKRGGCSSSSSGHDVRRGTEVVAPGSTRNRVGGDEPPRGFESHPLRHSLLQGRARFGSVEERCPSGRRGTTGNRVHVQKACRGF